MTMRARALVAAALAVTQAVSAAAVADLAERADFSALGAALAARAEVKTAQADGTTALHWAAQHDHEPSVAALLAAGAPPVGAMACGRAFLRRRDSLLALAHDALAALA